MAERDLAATSRGLRAEYLDACEVAEEAAEQLARKEADLADVIFDAMQRGQPVLVRVGTWQFGGTVVHVAADLAVIDDEGGAQVDLRLSAVDEVWIGEAVPGAGRGRRSLVPACFEDCLEGLEATGRPVELGGRSLAPTPCRVEVAALDHLVLKGAKGRHVVSRAGVGFVIRRP